MVVHDVRHIVADDVVPGRRTRCDEHLHARQFISGNQWHDVVLRGRLRTIRDHKLPAQVCGIVHEHTPVPILIQPESDALGRLPREWLVVLLVTR